MEKMGDTGMTPKHRDVVDKLRERLEHYRKHHNSCQTKQERSQLHTQEQERQDATLLPKRAIDGRAKMLNNKVKQIDLASKSDPQTNGLEMKSTNAILQQQILKRKFDQGLNNSANILSCDKENGSGGESMSKYQRTDDGHNTGLQPSHEIPNLNLPSQHEHSAITLGSQLDSLESLSNSTGIGGHFVNDGSRGSPLLTGHGVSSGPESYNPASRVQSQSPNTLQTPTEFKQEPRIAVSCEGGRLSSGPAAHESISNGVPLSNHQSRTSDNNNSSEVLAGQELQQQLKDFDDVLRKYGVGQLNSEISPPSHRAIQRPSQPGQLDNVTRETRTAQPSPTLPNPNAAQKQYSFSTGPQGPQGPTALHLQQLAAAQSQRAARAAGGYIDGQEQDTTNLNQYTNQNMPYFGMRFVSSGSQTQMPSQGTMPPQVANASRFHTPMPTASEHYNTSMYPAKDQNPQGIMSTGFPSNMASLQYQRMMQSQASQQQQQQQQQALYNRLNQQQMSHRLTHASIPEQQPYQQYAPQQGLNQGPQQMSNMQMQQNMQAYAVSGYPNMRPTSQTQYQRQHSMPQMSQGYLSQEQQYTQPIHQYSVSDQQVQNQPQQEELNTGAYHYNRRNSFPLYHRTMSQPAAAGGGYGQASHEGYTGPMAQMRNTLHGQNSGSAVINGRSNPSPGYSNYNARTPNMTTQANNQAMAHLQSQQRANSAMAAAAAATAAGVQMQPHSDQTTLRYGTPVNTQSATQDAKYNNRTNVSAAVRSSGYGDSMSNMALPERTTTPVSTNNNDSQFSAFSPLSALEKAPSFTSLLEQSTGTLTNLETTYTGSIPNLDLLGEIIG